MIRLLFTGLRFLKQYDVVKSLSFLQNLQDTIHYNSEYTILNLAFPGFEVFQNMFMLIFFSQSYGYLLASTIFYGFDYKG